MLKQQVSSHTDGIRLLDSYFISIRNTMVLNVICLKKTCTTVPVSFFEKWQRNIFYS